MISFQLKFPSIGLGNEIISNFRSIFQWQNENQERERFTRKVREWRVLLDFVYICVCSRSAPTCAYNWNPKQEEQSAVARFIWAQRLGLESIGTVHLKVISKLLFFSQYPISFGDYDI